MQDSRRRRVFHTVENFFPRCGNGGPIFSMLWKTGARFFHSVETFFPRYGKLFQHGDGIVIGLAAMNNHRPPPLQRERQHFTEQRPLCRGRLHGIIVIQPDLPHRHHARLLRQRRQPIQTMRLLHLIAVIADRRQHGIRMRLRQAHHPLVRCLRATHRADTRHPCRLGTRQNRLHGPLRRETVQMGMGIE